MPALFVTLVEDELGIGLLASSSGRGVDFVREGTDRDRNGNALGREEGELALPIEPARESPVLVSQ